MFILQMSGILILRGDDLWGTFTSSQDKEKAKFKILLMKSRINKTVVKRPTREKLISSASPKNKSYTAPAGRLQADLLMHLVGTAKE